MKEAQELLAQAQAEFDKKEYRKAKKLALRAQEEALEAQKKSIPGFRAEYQAEKKNKEDHVTKMMEEFGYDNIVNKNKASKTTSSVGAKKLYIDNETEVILVTVDEESFDRLIKGFMANDKYTLNELLLTGKVFTVPKGTKVKVLDVSWGKKEIRIGDIYLVAEALGHKAVETTKKYLGVSYDKLRRASEEIELCNRRKVSLHSEMNDSDLILELAKRGWDISSFIDKLQEEEKPSLAKVVKFPKAKVID